MKYSWLPTPEYRRLTAVPRQTRGTGSKTYDAYITDS